MFALTPFDTDHVPPEIGCVNCDVLLAHTVSKPAIAKFVMLLPTKLEVVPILAKLVNVPFEALLTVLIILFIDVLFPAGTP